jgi:acetolactate synthase-1/3 small subunit
VPKAKKSPRRGSAEGEKKERSEVERRLLSMIVSNQPGVLSRVTGLFTRRGYNIDSLTVSTTQDPEASRITVVVTADECMLEQVVKQVEKLIDVRVVTVLDTEPVTRREVALLKVKNAAGHALMDAVNAAHAAVVDVGAATLTVEYVGDIGEVDAFVGLLSPFGIVEMARTGLVALSRGDGCLTDKAALYD